MVLKECMVSIVSLQTPEKYDDFKEKWQNITARCKALKQMFLHENLKTVPFLHSTVTLTKLLMAYERNFEMTKSIHCV